MKTPQTYARAVVAVLADHFELDAVTRSVIVEAVTRQRTRRSRSFEVAVDHPLTAAWRLTPDPCDRSRVVLADFRMPPRDGDLPPDPRLDRVNRALVALG